MATPDEPTIQEMLKAGQIAIQGAADKNADFVRGSDYESLLGPCAIIWTREAQRDTDLFRAVNFNTADGKVLTDLALARYSKVRVMDSHGSGLAYINRISGGIPETIWKGTRILLTGANSRVYRVTADTPALTSDTMVVLPIEAEDIGPGTAVVFGMDATGRARLYDTLKDPSWYVSGLDCGDGTLFEQAEAFRARIRRERIADRVGQSASIIAACKAAGADNVVVFRSDYAGDDFDYGLNVCYVGNSGYTGTPTLVKACDLALRSVRVAGDSMQVLPMVPGTVAVVADVYLNDSPGKFDLTRLTNIHTAAINQYLNGPSGVFAYSIAGIRGAIIRNTPEVRNVDITPPSADATVVVGPNKNFPAALTRYVVSSVILEYLSN